MRIEAVELVAEVCRQRAIERRRPKVVFRQIYMIGIGLVNEAAVGKRFGKVDFGRGALSASFRDGVFAAAVENQRVGFFFQSINHGLNVF